MFASSCDKDLTPEGSKWFAERSGRNKILSSLHNVLEMQKRMREEKAPAFYGNTGWWLWPGSECSSAVTQQGWDPAPPRAAAATSLPMWSTSLSLIAAFSSLVHKALPERYCTGWGNNLLHSLPIPCCGFFFLGSYIVVNLFVPKVVSVTSERSCCIIFIPSPQNEGLLFPPREVQSTQCPEAKSLCVWPFALVTDPHFIQTRS